MGSLWIIDYIVRLDFKLLFRIHSSKFGTWSIDQSSLESVRLSLFILYASTMFEIDQKTCLTSKTFTSHHFYEMWRAKHLSLVSMVTTFEAHLSWCSRQQDRRCPGNVSKIPPPSCEADKTHSQEVSSWWNLQQSCKYLLSIFYQDAAYCIYSESTYHPSVKFRTSLTP